MPGVFLNSEINIGLKLKPVIVSNGVTLYRSTWFGKGFVLTEHVQGTSLLTNQVEETSCLESATTLLLS